VTSSRVRGTRALVAPLDAEAYATVIPGLAALRVDAVEGGASVNFLAPTTYFGKDLRGDG